MDSREAQLTQLLGRIANLTSVDDIPDRLKLLHTALDMSPRDKYPQAWAGLRTILAITIVEDPQANSSTSIEQAIALLEEAESVQDRSTYPNAWASTQNALSEAYRLRVQGDPELNIERAIGHADAFLHVFGREEYPEEWGIGQMNLGRAYRLRRRGDPITNLEFALECYDKALSVRTRELDPTKWAATQTSIGVIYRERLRGMRARNVDRAIAFQQRALSARSVGTDGQAWAENHLELARSFLERIRGDRAENIEAALHCASNALQVYVPDKFPYDWADAQSILGVAHHRRMRGDRGTNMEEAIECFHRAASVYERGGRSPDLAQVQVNLAVAYLDRTSENRAKSIETSIRLLKKALEVFTRKTWAIQWATTKNILGTACRYRIESDREANIEQAIDHIRSALGVLSATAHPLQWAKAMINLGLCYLDGEGDERPGSQASAIGCFEQALGVITRGMEPVIWATLQLNLGNAHYRASQGGGAGLLDAAVENYKRALQVFGSKSFPAEHRGASSNLAYVLSVLGRWDEAVDIFGEALNADTAAFRSIQDSSTWQADFGNSARLHLYASYAHAQSGDLRAAVVLFERSRTRAFRQITQLAGTTTGHDDALPSSSGDPNFAALEESLQQASPIAYVAVTEFGSMILLVHNLDATGTAGGSVVVERLDTLLRPSLTVADLIPLLVQWDNGVPVGGYFPAQLRAPEWLRHSLSELLPVLGERLLRPLGKRLTEMGADRVTLVVDGLLELLPLHAALYEGDGGRRRLLDDVGVTYAPSARGFVAARADAAVRQGNLVLAGAANPDTELEDLPFAEAELQEIASLLPNSRCWWGEDATKMHLIEAASRAGYVHLACHGEFDTSDPLKSGFALTRRGQSDWLTVSEILDQRPFAQARVVVASACKSRVTDPERLMETSGLTPALMFAGTPGVIAALWSVDDIATAILMTRLYEYHVRGDVDKELGPMEPWVALRRAQQWLMRATDAELRDYVKAHPALGDAWRTRGLQFTETGPFDDPYYWSAFTYTGG